MTRAKFGRIGVLAGGPSNEREISLRSGEAVYNALKGEGIDAIFLDIKDDIHDVVKRNAVDVAFIALHGRFGEDGTVQKMLEDARIPYTGSGPEASALALDKIASKEAFVKSGIPVPRYIAFEKNRFSSTDADGIGYPLVVKPRFEGSSIGLSIVKDSSLLKEALEKAFKYGDVVMLEEYIHGRELTVGILDDKALPVIEIVTRNNVYDYEAKYKNNDTRYIVPAEIGPDAQKKAKELGVMAHNALGCRSFSRVDIIMDDKGEMFVLEVNTIPGMTQRSLLPKAAQAIGLRFNELCVKILENTLSGAKK
ncbi:MAG: D-alanine--D-alanine ligase [Candidatus Omnitrophota bacterium]|nr:D-alanine--D-alanine ligase [Candidatus Omnitrophota bacterium]